MLTSKKICALIYLRGNSKSIPRKNIKLLAGKPLCYWVLKAASESKYIDEIYVSTEDTEIKQIVTSFNLGIRVIDRPMELAGDATTAEEIVAHFMRQVSDFDILTIIQATSPLTKNSDIDSALERFFDNKYDSMLTGVVIKRFLWSKDGKPLNYDYKERPMRQQFEGSIIENGAFYITKKEILENEKNRLGGTIGVFVMPEQNEVELDELADWEKLEKIIANDNSLS